MSVFFYDLYKSYLLSLIIKVMKMIVQIEIVKYNYSI